MPDYADLFKDYHFDFVLQDVTRLHAEQLLEFITLYAETMGGSVGGGFAEIADDGEDTGDGEEIA